MRIIQAAGIKNGTVVLPVQEKRAVFFATSRCGASTPTGSDQAFTLVLPASKSEPKTVILKETPISYS